MSENIPTRSDAGGHTKAPEETEQQGPSQAPSQGDPPTAIQETSN